MRNRAVLILCACILGAGAARAAAPPEVTTLAGSGAAGIADGPALKATFLFPSGIAIARDGSIYISDRAAQRIRLLTRSGEVRTVAGSGAIVPPGLIVPPGYRDGPALQAQFNGPEGLAIGPDGALYIADLHNACIRKLWNGQVTTVLGKVGDARAIDGALADARLMYPRALAFDTAGNLYIADDGGGLRRFGRDGILTTIRPSNVSDFIDEKLTSATIGVAVPIENDPEILVSAEDFPFSYRPSTGNVQEFDPGAGTDDHAPFGTLNQIVALGRRQFLITDAFSSNIRYMRLPDLPFVGTFTRVIAGGSQAEPIDNAGFADGPRAAARFYEPMGIAVEGNRAIVADGGNRRIREIQLPHFRVSETGFDAANSYDATHYEVALVGASWTFWDSLGDDSICAAIERTLDRSRRFSKPVRCHTISVNAGEWTALESYVRNVFPNEHADLVIMDAETFRAKFDPSPELFRSRMQQLQQFLTPLGTQLSLVWVYAAGTMSDAEVVVGSPASRQWPRNSLYQHDVTLESQLRGLPILQYNLYPDMVRYQLSKNAQPLYHAENGHPNPRGNAFFGNHIAQGLLDAGLGRP